jgi:hypothetical protein
MSILAIPSCAALVILVLVVAIAMVVLGDLSLITPTDLEINWQPTETFEDMLTRTSKELNDSLDNWEVFEDPTALVEPKNVKPVVVVVVDEAVAMEVAEIPLRMFSRPSAVYFVDECIF